MIRAAGSVLLRIYWWKFVLFQEWDRLERLSWYGSCCRTQLQQLTFTQIGLKDANYNSNLLVIVDSIGWPDWFLWTIFHGPGRICSFWTDCLFLGLQLVGRRFLFCLFTTRSCHHVRRRKELRSGSVNLLGKSLTCGVFPFGSGVGTILIFFRANNLAL